MSPKPNPTCTFVAFALLLCACGAPRVDVVNAGIATVTITPGHTHELYAVFAEQKGPELWIFGKVKLTGGTGDSTGHVDGSIVDKEGERLQNFSLPTKKQGKRRPGWVGANFRTKLPIVVPGGATIRLAYHDDPRHCPPSD